MREILFKAKRVDNGEWVEGCLNDTGENSIKCSIHEHEHPFREHPVIPETVCQYTGMRDKNGQRIFEGDLIRYNDSVNGVGFFNTISSDCARVVFSYEYAGGWVADKNGKTVNIGTRSDKFEITGNIHDTAEATE